MLQDNMTALEITEHLYSIKLSGKFPSKLGSEVLKMYMNILKMVGELSQLEVTHRKYGAKNGHYTQRAVDHKRQEIFKAIGMYEQYVIMLKLMS